MTPLRSPFSWREDPEVPAFPDQGSITVMDATCGLCAKGAAWIARHDHAQAFRIIPLQSDLGCALMRHFGMNPDDPTSWLYLEDGQPFSSLDALIRVGATLGGPWKSLMILRLIPKSLRDFSYRLVARNRYRLMGRADLCALPDPDIQMRLLK